MPLWEYCKINLSALPTKKNDVDVLNEAGESGWQLVTIIPSTNVAYLMRRLEEPVAEKRSPVKQARAK